jgi:DNA polymerase III alpha subunit
MRDFVNIHTHTNLGSMLDALSGVDELFDRVKELGQKAIAVTDHGTLAAHFDSFKAYKRTGIKFIPGCEAYFVHSYDHLPAVKGRRKRTEKRKHIVLLAQNHIGYKNLLMINYAGFENNVIVMGRTFPRINFDILEKYNEGIIATSACGSGIISSSICEDDYDAAMRYAEKLSHIFEDRFYIEIQPHRLKDDRLDQLYLNKKLISIAEKLGLPIVAGVDAHYLTRESEKVHDILLAINAKAPVDDPNRHKYGTDEFYVKTGDDVYNFISKYHDEGVAEQAVTNTVNIANRCENPDYMETMGNHLPIFNPKGEPDYDEFVQWCKKLKYFKVPEDKAYMRFCIVKGFKKKFGHLDIESKKERWERVKSELKILEGNNFSSYMLVTADFIKWAKDNKILVGVGRGCITEDALVLTNRGFVKISEVKFGDMVYTHKGKLEMVSGTYVYGVDPSEELVQINTDYGFGSLTFTKNHKVLGMKSSIFLEFKLRIYKKLGMHDTEEPKWITAGDLSVGDLLFVPFINHDSTYTNKLSHYIDKCCQEVYNEYGDITLDEKSCYLIGRWIGGDLDEYSDYYDSRLIEVLTKIFACHSGSNEVKKRIGKFVNLPRNLLRQLIIGIKHSCRRIYVNRECIHTTSYQLASDIRESLLYLKIPNTVSLRSNIHNGFISSKPCRYDNIYIDILFTGLEEDLEYEHKINDEGYFVKIDNISNTDSNYVYDICVSCDHSYVTQNYAVHNSIGGCMIAYLLGIHGVDPLEYGLLFERFQNAYKKELPDIDTDFTSKGRDLVQEYVREKYGRHNCAQVSNINTYTPKNVIPDLVKSMRNVMPGLIPEGENYVRIAEVIKKAIPDNDSNGNEVKTLRRAIELSPKLKIVADRCPELMEYADSIIGMPKEYSTHAAGMVISDVPIYEFAPLRIDKNGELAVQYEKKRCEALGLVKMDFLAVLVLDIIDETFKNIAALKNDNAPSRMEDIPLDDQETYRMIQEGHTRCVFQLGKSALMVSLCKTIKPRNILDIAVINVLARPSGKRQGEAKGTRELYIERRIGTKDIVYPHDSLKETLHKTYGLAIMEDQLMGVAKSVAGWDLNKADDLRKFTKSKGKDPELDAKIEKEFVDDAMKTHNMTRRLAQKIWDQYVKSFSGYGFNASHATSYSITGYITAYLKRHYPAEFLAAYLKIKTNKGGVNRDDEISSAKIECRRLGIRIVPPDVNGSSAGYEMLDKDRIVMGLSAIKGMGAKAVDEIVSKQTFDSFIDFLHRVDGRVVNKSKLEVMSKAGCFDSLGISRKDVCGEGKKTRDKMNAFIRKRVKDGYEVEEIDINEFSVSFSNDEWSTQEKLRYENEVLGELISGSVYDMFPGFFTDVMVTYISRIKNLPNRQRIMVEVVVKSLLREFEIKSGKSAGKKMAKYLIEDKNGTETELTVWPSEYERVRDAIIVGRPMRAACEVNDFNDTKSLILLEIQQIYNE